jgi:DNA-binding IclR family transcriptional regulator
VKDGDEAVNIVQVPSPQMVKHIEWIGRRRPLHCTAVGKVLLACMPVAELQTIISGGLHPYTPNTIIDPELLCQELARVSEQGYATGKEEFEIGLNAIAAPVHDNTQEVVAALSVSGPAFRLSPDRFPAMAEYIQTCALAVSRQIGYSV